MLSPTETKVLHGLARGLQAKAIANEMNKSVRTVEMQMVHLRARLGAKTTPHAVAIALALGLIEFSVEEANAATSLAGADF